MILFFILVDQYLKYLALHGLLRYDWVVLKTTLVKNPGISFGILGGFSPLLIASLQLLALVWIYRLKLPKSITILCLAGGISNFIDRLYHGFVIDYIQLQLLGYQWPTVINLADFYLFLSLILWLIHFRKSVFKW